MSMPKNIQTGDISPGARQQEIDRLFQMTQRGPFSGQRQEEVLSETDGFVLQTGGVTEEQYWPIYLQSYIRGGFINDRFLAGPPDGLDSEINNTTNRLPGWEKFLWDRDSGSAHDVDDFTMVWEATPGGTGNKQLKITIPASVGTPWQDGYYVGIRQRVHTQMNDLHQMWPSWYIEAETGSGDVLDAQTTLLKYMIYPDGTRDLKTDPDFKPEADVDIAGRIYRTPQTTDDIDAAFYEYAFLIGSPTEDFDDQDREFIVKFTSLLEPVRSYHTMMGFSPSVTPVSETRQEIKHLNFIDGAAHEYFAPRAGYVDNITATHGTGITNTTGGINHFVNAWNPTDGSRELRFEDDAAFGVQPQVSGTQKGKTARANFNGNEDMGWRLNEFKAGDQLTMQAEADASWTGSGSAEIQMVVDIALFADSVTAITRDSTDTAF